LLEVGALPSALGLVFALLALSTVSFALLEGFDVDSFKRLAGIVPSLRAEPCRKKRGACALSGRRQSPRSVAR